MSRTRQKRRGPVWSEIRGMQHRRPDPGCPLCPLWGVPFDQDNPATHGRQHAHAELLWQEWDGRPDWAERVAQVAATLGVAATPEQARRHFSYHKIEQPAASGRPQRSRLVAEVLDMPPVSRQMITHLYRQRMLTRDQLTELFFLSNPALNDRSAQAAAQTEIQRLIRGHFAFRWYPPAEWGQRSSRERDLKDKVFFFFGRSSAPWIEYAYSAKVWDDAYVTHSRQIGLATLLHDTKVSEVYVALQRSLRSRGYLLPTPEGDAPAFSLLENWYGTRQLVLRLWDRIAMEEIDMRPDGFATLSLERSPGGERPACQLPFFYEYDNGSKKPADVAAQMFAYHRLALSERDGRPGGVAGERFPDLRVDGYGVPMVMVFSDPRRVQEIGRAFRRHAERQGVRNGIPILLVYDRDWMADPFAPAIIQVAWDIEERRLSLTDALVRSSRRLIEAGAVGARQLLTLDDTTSRRRRSS